jgi:hypothetical protein
LLFFVTGFLLPDLDLWIKWHVAGQLSFPLLVTMSVGGGCTQDGLIAVWYSILLCRRQTFGFPNFRGWGISSYLSVDLQRHFLVEWKHRVYVSSTL